MKILHGVAFMLVIIGGLNWLLVGLAGWDVGSLFGGQGAALSRIIYILVGLSALYLVVSHKSDCKQCETSAPAATPSASM
ncbi:MAG: DUF378 domain-containing protein [Candidatus Nomurabacteria bacterium]|nr:DUF378 domain-containing protein [Candidatus Nomurabacteria bacterium]